MFFTAQEARVFNCRREAPQLWQICHIAESPERLWTPAVAGVAVLGAGGEITPPTPADAAIPPFSSA